MDQQLLQRTRYVLRSRVRRVQTCPLALFAPTSVQFLAWLTNHPILSSLSRGLQHTSTESTRHIREIVQGALETERSFDPGFYNAKSTEEHAALCLAIVQAAASSIPSDKRDFVFQCLGEYLTGNASIEIKEAVEALRDVAVDGLYEYLDEQLDARNVLYAILVKYKQRSEWYHRSRLRDVADSGLEGQVGERALAIELQEYVLDQGVEFTVEPSSVSGEADLILRDSEGRYIIVDAKYISADSTPSAIKYKLASGFHQVSRYCNDYNEPAGFLVSFNRTSMSIRLELEDSDGLLFLRLGGRTVFYLPINIADVPSASKAGKASEVFVSANELVSPPSIQSV